MSNVLQPIPAAIHAVIDENGRLSHAAVTRQMAHDHINDAITEHDIEGAEKWVVREYQPRRADFQTRVAQWMQETFGPEVSADQRERSFRFGEEAIELLQAGGCSKEDVLKLVDYVFSRPVGDFEQEVGGTMLTLTAWCDSRKVDVMNAAHTEQTRCEQPEVRAKIQRKQAAKRAMMDTPLPGRDPQEVR
jgi:hypothetical protein